MEVRVRAGIAVTDVARRLGVREGLPDRWLQRLRVEPPASMAAVPATFASGRAVGSDPTQPGAAVPPMACLSVEMPDGARVHFSGWIDPGRAAPAARTARRMAG